MLTALTLPSPALQMYGFHIVQNMQTQLTYCGTYLPSWQL